MQRVRPPKRKRKPRRYHLKDDDMQGFEAGDNPDWLVGAD